MTVGDSGYIRDMPSKGQKRELPKDLRVVLAESVKLRMEDQGLSATTLGKSSGVGRRTIDRLLSAKTATNIDTIQAIAEALELQQVSELFTRPKNGAKAQNSIEDKYQNDEQKFLVVLRAWEQTGSRGRTAIWGVAQSQLRRYGKKRLREQSSSSDG